MSTLFTTDDVPADARVDYWERMVSHQLLPLRGAPDPADFHARMVAGSVGAVRVVETTTPAGECVRTPRLVSRAGHDLHQIEVVAHGRVVVEQDGRQARLDAGDLAFVDTTRPVRFAASASTHVAVLFPPAMLPIRRADLARVTGTRIAGDRGAGALVSTLARQLPHHLDDSAPAEAARLGTSIVDLLAVALSTRLDAGRPLPPRTRRGALLRQVYAFVDTHLGDPHLSPGSIAAAHHISRRYLHKLFEAEHTTAAQWIRSRRLERCRRDLRDPGQRLRPVVAVAARHGLTDPAHFSRIFKAAYGSTPGEFRRAAQPPTG